MRKVEFDPFLVDMARTARHVAGGKQAKPSVQTTIAAPITLESIGLHSGAKLVMTLRPASVGHGIVFRRADLAHRGASVSDIAASYENVSDTKLCTMISNAAGTSIATIEHLMAAIAAFSIDNLLIEVDGAEVPIMDGSAALFAEAFEAVGLNALSVPRQAIRILKPVMVEEGNRHVALLPGEGFHLSFDIEFADRAIGRQMVEADLNDIDFASDFLTARTFGRLADVEMLQAAGLGLGGSLENSVIVDGDKVLNPDGLRFEDECVRHKLIDAVGDLALAGAPFIGRYEGVRAGHALNNRLLRALFADASAWEFTTLAEGQARPMPVPAMVYAAVGD